jgi:hypothetical protein
MVAATMIETMAAAVVVLAPVGVPCQSIKELGFTQRLFLPSN